MREERRTAKGRWPSLEKLRDRVADEQGTVRKEAPFRVALLYPSPYHTAMSSLGYQVIYRVLNDLPGVAADRAVLPDEGDEPPELLTLERERPVGEYPIIAASVAYELEIPGLLECLRLSGLPPLAAERAPGAPLVVAGGPLTFSNPVPLAPFCDVILMGEAEELVVELVARFQDTPDRDALLEALAGRPGFYVPRRHGDTPPPVAKVDDDRLPARSVRNIDDSSVCGVMMTERAGRRSSSTLATGGGVSPWRRGT